MQTKAEHWTIACSLLLYDEVVWVMSSQGFEPLVAQPQTSSSDQVTNSSPLFVYKKKQLLLLLARITSRLSKTECVKISMYV